jgi:hypothetical protein
MWLLNAKEPETDMAVMEVVDTQDNWYLHKLDHVKDYAQKWPDWKVENGKLHLRLDQLGKVIDQTTDRWTLVVLAKYLENHDRPMAGHLVITKTFYKMSQLYYWPRLFRDIANYIKKCKTF